MKRIQSWIRESYGWKRFPKISVGLTPSLLSFELGISLLLGYFVALFLAGSRTHVRGKIPSLVFRFRQYRIHLHHWLLFLHVLVLAAIMHFFVVTPLLFYGFLGGIVAQGVFHYEDWRQVVQKVS